MPKRKAAEPAAEADAEAPSTSQAGDEPSSVMYIGHLPHGFYEQQLKGYFGQFGTVVHLKVSRNKKTAKAKHYGFIQFQSPEVAAIAAEAMDGYMLFTQKLVCHVLPASKVHPELFKGTGRPFRKVPWQKIEATRQNRERSREQQEQRLERAAKRDRLRQRQIRAAGIEYAYEPLGVAAKQPAPAAAIEARGGNKRKAAAGKKA